MWRIFKVPFVSGQPSFWKRKKDIHEDILDDDVDIKVESKKFDEKISPPPSLLVVHDLKL